MHDEHPFAPGTSGAEQPVDLSALDAEFEQAETATSEEVPDGKYQARIHGVRMNKTQKGDPMLQYDLIVLSGSQQGRHLFKNSVLTPAAMPYVKGDLKLLGVTLARLSELPDRLPELLDKTVEVTKKTKEERSNVYLNRLLKLPAGAASGPTPF